ncbi:MAG TPA: hypothetical protein VFG87_11780 [Amycolatopsis sp.]|nr:hypothetical protein [Amycolatopsis sp.]
MRTSAGPAELAGPDGAGVVPGPRRGAGAPGKRLRPLEVATAGVLAGVAVEMVALGALLPRAGALELLAAVPLAIVARRHRLRATATAAIAGSVTAFTCAGLDAGVAVLACGVIGAVVGSLYRRSRSPVWPSPRWRY